jgi:hypothetical protein
MDQPWHPGDTPGEQDARRLAYLRLVNSAKRVGVSLTRLHSMLGQVAANEAATRQFLADEVYGVPDDLLDDLVRVHMEDLGGEPDEPTG